MYLQCIMKVVISAVGFALVLYTLYVMSSYMNIKYDTTGIYMFWFVALMIFYATLPSGDTKFRK